MKCFEFNWGPLNILALIRRENEKKIEMRYSVFSIEINPELV